ncbi:hypothetical protein [Arthrobacter sp. H-02-3]|uniref:hypothetical protein n=1 Tax=Arthrobacter sp. H-02-3 TaxID=2703675 RepID=UPI001F1B1CEE|nr:hypothetical protein [Arthrobacter sp. H-02-3]
MSGQHPGAGSGPVPEPTAPAPVTTPQGVGPQAAWQHDAPPYDASQSQAGQRGDGATLGRGAPSADSTVPESAPVWGMPGQELPSPPAAGWGAPGTGSKNASAAKPWTLKRGLAVAGAAAVLAVGAGAGVYALTSSSAASAGTAGGVGGALGPGAQGFAPGMPGSAQGGAAGGGMSGQGGPGNFAAGGMGGLNSAVHADYVVLQGSDYVTMAEQMGTVSAVTSSSVTVKSSDGFTRSYALGSDVVVSNLQQRRQQAGGGSGTQLSVTDIVAGGTVRIVAAKDGSGYTARSVMVVAATSTGQSN